MGASKIDLRKKYLARRKALSPAAVSAWSAQIHNHAFPRATGRGAVFIYVAVKDHEVTTLPLIERLWAAGVRVFAPRCEGLDLDWRRLRESRELIPGPFGLLEPAAYCPRPTPADCRGAVLAPGIVFAKNGHRIGYGGGYFDRFLTNHRGPVYGLCYACQVVERLPTEMHDRAVDALITECGVVDCS